MGPIAFIRFLNTCFLVSADGILWVWDLSFSGETVIVPDREDEPSAFFSTGNKPDYGSGPYLALMASAVRLARSDMENPVYSVEARAWLRSDFVALFAECLGYEGVMDA